jgi:hypothetical protein
MNQKSVSFDSNYFLLYDSFLFHFIRSTCRVHHFHNSKEYRVQSSSLGSFQSLIPVG